MKHLIYIFISFLLLSACTADGDGILPTSDEQNETRAKFCMPMPEGEDLHGNLQGEWTRDDITFIGDLILGGWAGQYMKIAPDTMYLYALGRYGEFGWNGDETKWYISVSDFDTIPYTFKDPNLLIAKTDTFRVYENKEDSAYYLLGRQCNFKLTTFFFDKSSYPEDVEYKVIPNEKTNE